MSIHSPARPTEPLTARVERARSASAPTRTRDDARTARLKDLAAYAVAGGAGAVAAALVSWWLVANISLPIPV